MERKNWKAATNPPPPRWRSSPRASWSGYGVAHATTVPDEPGAGLRMGAVPGWEGVVEPVLAAIAADTGGEVGIELDWEWQDAHAAADVEEQIVSAVAAGSSTSGFVGTRVRRPRRPRLRRAHRTVPRRQLRCRRRCSTATSRRRLPTSMPVSWA